VNPYRQQQLQERLAKMMQQQIQQQSQQPIPQQQQEAQAPLPIPQQKEDDSKMMEVDEDALALAVEMSKRKEKKAQDLLKTIQEKLPQQQQQQPKEGEQAQQPQTEQPQQKAPTDEEVFNAAKQSVNQQFLAEMKAMDFSEFHAVKALLNTGNASVDAAVRHHFLFCFSNIFI